MEIYVTENYVSLTQNQTYKKIINLGIPVNIGPHVDSLIALA